MRMLLIIPVLYSIVVLLGCTTVPPHHPHPKKAVIKETVVAYIPPKHKHHKDPLAISLYPKEPVEKRPYRVIGKETVSRYNFVGFKRQAATVHDIMRDLAASIGGDAIINIRADNEKVEGTVISFERVLL